jgi:hypothetical protein
LIQGSCTRAVDAIDDLGEGDLGRVKGLLLERHARRCGECASYLNRMGTVVEGLARLGKVYAPDDLVGSVMAHLISGDDSVEEQGAAGKRGRRNLVLVAGAAGVGVGAAIGLAIARWVIGRERGEALAPVSSA